MFKTLLVFYLLVGAGYLLKTLKVFKKEDVAAFVNYIIHFALPVAVLGVIHDFSFTPKDSVIFLTAWVSIGLSFLFVFKVLKTFVREEKKLKTLMLTCSFGNTAFVGYPVAYTLFGDKGLAYAIIYDVIGNFLVVVTLAVFIITGRLEWRTVYKFPPLGALLLAFLTKPISLAFLKPFIVSVKASITPTIVFSLGLRLEPKEAFKNIGWATLSVVWRQFVVPLFVFFFLLLLEGYFSLPPEELGVILLQSAMPPFVMSVILSEKYKLETDLALAAVNLGLLVLLVSLPLWFSVAKRVWGS